MVDLHRVACRFHVVPHHACLVFLDGRLHVIGCRQGVLAGNIRSDPGCLVLHEADDTWDRLSEADEHEVVDAGNEDAFEER